MKKNQGANNSDIELGNLKIKSIDFEDSTNKSPSLYGFFTSLFQGPTKNEKLKLISQGNENRNYQSISKNSSLNTDNLKTLYDDLKKIDVSTINETNYIEIKKIGSLKAYAIRTFPNRKKDILSFKGSMDDFKKLIRNTLFKNGNIQLPEAKMMSTQINVRDEPPILGAMVFGFLSVGVVITSIFFIAYGYGYFDYDKLHHKNNTKDDLAIGKGSILLLGISLFFFIASAASVFKLEEIPILALNSIRNYLIAGEYHKTFNIDPPDFLDSIQDEKVIPHDETSKTFS